ncbi:NTPase [Streptomyces nigrescens]|uniref:NTPase n=1 Tax=Streptomyces nigrescens TaxID=1920 RepID=A0ABN6R285_STRNI|nr:tetratricopeptide repeat protein [Streptomyces nigrescens]BDM70729.1 NTPase [Streptomyces nigrescens]
MPSPELGDPEELLSAMVTSGAQDSLAWRELASIVRAAAQEDRSLDRDWLTAVDGTPTAVRQLAATLDELSRRDTQLNRRLGTWLRRHAPPSGSSVSDNSIGGTARINGPSIQAHEVRGGIHIHQPAQFRPPVPHQLPPVRAELVGRTADLEALERLRSGHHGQAQLLVVSGLAGVGKTTLVSRWLQQCAEDYPDGRLYADLGGHTGDVGLSVQPAEAYPGGHRSGPSWADPSDILEGFLRALGLSSVPTGTAQRVALWRSLTSGLRLAVMLDDAATAAQVRPLLLGAPGSLTVVTSRSNLTGLVVDGAALHRLGALTPDSAVELLSAGGGGTRVAQAPIAAREVVSLCACLPLAVCLAAAQLAFRPHWSISSLADSLAQGHGPLDSLRVDGEAVVRTALDSAYHLLPRDAAALYRRLGLLPADRYDLHILTAISGLRPDRTEMALNALMEANLLEETGPGRYRLHSLVRSHACRSGEAEEPPAERADTLRRFTDWCLRTATSAESILTPSHRTAARHYACPSVRPTPLDGPAEALTWFDEHRTGLMGAVRHSAQAGWHTTCWQLVDAMWPWFLRLRPAGAWIEAHRLALTAARRAGDRAGEGRMLTSGAIGLRDAGQYGEALSWFTEALELAAADKDMRQQAQALNGIGHVKLRAGRPDEAQQHFERALELRESLGYRRGAALSRIRLGETALANGDPARAAEHLALAHSTLEQEGERYEAARALALLGHVQTCHGSGEEGVQRLREALQMFRQPSAHSRHWQGRCLEWLGQSAQGQGDVVEARQCYEAARDLYKLLSPPDTQRLEDRLRQL